MGVFLLLLVSHALLTSLTTVNHIALPFRSLRPLNNIFLPLGKAGINGDLGARLLFALWPFLRFFVEPIVRGGAELSIGLFAGPLEVSIVLGSAGVGFSIEKEIRIYLYLFFNEVMQRL